MLSDFEQLWKNTCNGVWDDEESLIEVSFYAPTVTGVSANDPCGRIGKWNGVQASGIRSVRNAGNWRVIPTFLRDWKDGETVVSRAEDIVAHAKYIRDMAGIEALGLGSDFDGMNGELEIASRQI